PVSEDTAKFGTNHNRLSPALNMQARCSDGQSLGTKIIDGQVNDVCLPWWLNPTLRHFFPIGSSENHRTTWLHKINKLCLMTIASR
ncbi:hypothetical protein, partial [Undibacterium sp. Ren11W]|uniref:hypothetical protein n=1 Tax=Undibacterium sp. Ren11W TaxID=3413045 RepID=UPI003BF3A6AF